MPNYLPLGLYRRDTRENIVKILAELADEFSIKDIGAIVTDNPANMLVTARKGGYSHHPCYAHTLQLAIEDVLKVPTINKALAHARRLVTHFSHSTIAVEALKKQQQTTGNQTPLMLIQDVQT